MLCKYRDRFGIIRINIRITYSSFFDFYVMLLVLVRGHLLSNLCSSRRPSWPSRYMQQCRTFSITVSETITIRRSTPCWTTDGTWTTHLALTKLKYYELLQPAAAMSSIPLLYLPFLLKYVRWTKVGKINLQKGIPQAPSEPKRYHGRMVAGSGSTSATVQDVGDLIGPLEEACLMLFVGWFVAWCPAKDGY